ncbi:PA3496 family putative envelope integrity protein [Arsukibacterium sp.]|uniref:PA3496 family putative envelope integrity protein n=1 Tax=Arsukibacterium sp. TaxID=1977258 RepID=UPI002FDA528B
MSSLPDVEMELDELAPEIELVKETVVKDSKAKQRYEARRRIDDLLEQKRLRALLDDWDLLDD